MKTKQNITIDTSGPTTEQESAVKKQAFQNELKSVLAGKNFDDMLAYSAITYILQKYGEYDIYSLAMTAKPDFVMQKQIDKQQSAQEHSQVSFVAMFILGMAGKVAAKLKFQDNHMIYDIVTDKVYRVASEKFGSIKSSFDISINIAVKRVIGHAREINQRINNEPAEFTGALISISDKFTIELDCKDCINKLYQCAKNRNCTIILSAKNIIDGPYDLGFAGNRKKISANCEYQKYIHVIKEVEKTVNFYTLAKRHDLWFLHYK